MNSKGPDYYEVAKYSKKNANGEEWLDREHPFCKFLLDLMVILLIAGNSLYITIGTNNISGCVLSIPLSIMIYILAVILASIDFIITYTEEFIINFGMLSIIITSAISLFIIMLMIFIANLSALWIIQRVTDGRLVLAIIGLVLSLRFFTRPFTTRGDK